MKIYFTRLTPNFNNWKQPSGKDGKCLKSKIYEAANFFGWEEWLFAQYHIHKSDPEFICNGFVEAFNQKNLKIDKIDRLYLYTRVAKNTKSIPPGYYFVGYINYVSRIKCVAKTKDDVKVVLKDENINHENYIQMLPFALNISFKAKDVHVDFNGVFKRPICLDRGQYRFGLYDMDVHLNFKKIIANY